MCVYSPRPDNTLNQIQAVPGKFVFVCFYEYSRIHYLKNQPGKCRSAASCLRQSHLTRWCDFFFSLISSDVSVPLFLTWLFTVILWSRNKAKLTNQATTDCLKINHDELVKGRIKKYKGIRKCKTTLLLLCIICILII